MAGSVRTNGAVRMILFIRRQHTGPVPRLINVSGLPRTAKLIALALLTAWAGVAQAVVLDPPTLRCASVNVAGDVTLTWTAPADPGGDFNSYEIYHSNSLAGPYTLIFTIGTGMGQSSSPTTIFARVLVLLYSRLIFARACAANACEFSLSRAGSPV